MISKQKIDREFIIIFICLNKLFIFSTNYDYCKNKKMSIERESSWQSSHKKLTKCKIDAEKLY